MMQILRVLPKNILSQCVGGLVSIEQPEAVAIRARDWFIKRYKINLEEAEFPLAMYPSISKLFTRRLKPGVRPIGEGVVHPCDGELTCVEVIDYDTLIQAKGKKYSISKLLRDQTAPKKFSGGAHLVYYLCPTDYHRVHSPIDGHISRVTHVPGHLWPVNSWSVNNIDELFSENERVIFHIDTALGPVALVMVGATNVGKITVSFDAEIITNRAGQSSTAYEKTYRKPIPISKGQELGIFNMGSTVVMIYPRKMINVLPKLGAVKLGQSL
jgi:phosphatidylserine decarboxylase